ncbi:MAG: PAS domain-containing protein [Planctomycetes bacterium]|nr:PAS domain-containing protein [Planctomycetota bacterium]
MSEVHYLHAELQEKLRSDGDLFQFFTDIVLDGIWYWDIEHPEHEWLSPKFWTLLGYDPASRRHRSAEWKDLIDPDDLALAIRNFEAHCADASHPYDQIVRYRHRQGHPVWVRCRGLAIRDE